jgi:hypothetical protein
MSGTCEAWRCRRLELLELFDLFLLERSTATRLSGRGGENP